MVAPEVVFEDNIETMEVMNCLKFLGGYSSKDGGPHEDMDLRVDEGLKTFVIMNEVLT